METNFFQHFKRRWLLLLALLLVGLMLPVYYASTTKQTVHGRTTDKTAPQAELQQVLLTRSQLEEVRRQVVGGMRATDVFLLYHLEQIAKDKSDQEAALIKGVLAEARERLRVTQLDLSKLDHLAGLSAWKEQEAAALSQVVQQRLHALQHPANCTTAKKLVCQADRPGAGSGSIIHDIVHCLMAAYETGRTMVLQSKVKTHIGTNWEEVFLPPSQAECKHLTSNMTNWPGTEQAEAVFFPANSHPRPQLLHPLAVPRDLASRIAQFSDMPGVWLVGQFVSYLLRLQPSVQQKTDTIERELNYNHPIVAIHVRRTDKTRETPNQPLETYMEHVEDYYLGLDLASPSAPSTPRRVFLATDLPSVVTEARKKYPTYEFLWHPNKAEKVESRMTTANIQDFIAELYLLAHADYLVCTFSSNVCRLSFEWMHSLRTDASSRVVSVDTNYVINPISYLHLVRFPHNPKKSAWKKGAIEVEAGEQVSSYKTVGRDGYVQVNILRKHGGVGYLPDYKLKDVVDIVNFTFIKPSLN